MNMASLLHEIICLSISIHHLSASTHRENKAHMDLSSGHLFLLA